MRIGFGIKASVIAVFFGIQSFAQSIGTHGSGVSVPFQMVKSFGNRPSLKAQINGFPVTLIVHSNASFSIQLSHQAAQKGKVTDLHPQDQYGIVKTGEVSKRGRDTAFVDTFTIGKHAFTHVHASIFETPSPYDQGMLGLRWLRTNRAVIDYTQKIITLNPDKPINASQLQSYIAIPMQRDPVDGRYLVAATVNRISRFMVISTVADNTFDTDFALKASIHSTDTGDTYGGPTGTTGSIYVVDKPVAIQLAGTSFQLPTATVVDLYAYEAKPRPANAADLRGGMLGAEFLLAQRAIVDFGRAILYVKP